MMMAPFLLLLLIVLTMSSADSLSFTLQGKSCRMYESKNASPEKNKTLRLVGKQRKNKHTFQQAFVIGSDYKRPAVTSEPAVWHLGVPIHPVASIGGVNTKVKRAVFFGLQLTDKLLRKCLHDCVIVREDEILAHAMAAGFDLLALHIARRVK